MGDLGNNIPYRRVDLSVAGLQQHQLEGERHECSNNIG